MYLGSTSVTTDKTGAATFTTAFAKSVAAGQVITATATGVQSSPPAGQAAGLGTSPLASPITAATPFTVTTTADKNPNGSPAVGSLRQAIINANATTAAVIDFDLSTEDPNYNPTTGTWTITLDPTALPPITSQVTIDGTSQPGYYGKAAINPTAPRRSS